MVELRMSYDFMVIFDRIYWVFNSEDNQEFHLTRKNVEIKLKPTIFDRIQNTQPSIWSRWILSHDQEILFFFPKVYGDNDD